ncbi:MULTISPECIES: HPr kinase/phosphorylase [unclassified Mesorhizobium]|uniref:HPr kinase/phosphorylase n=1 Tax=unclassified Mesorhizobium TaxID=325217 RepID=UPI003015019D
MVATNLHGTALVLGDRGVLILGASGSGKSTLALTLIAQFQASSRLARLVGDDQVLISARGGHLLCKAPPTIGGLVEVFGQGPRPVGFEECAVIDLLVRLVSPADTERLPEDRFEEIAGCRLPCLFLAERNATGAALALSARLSLPPFL